MTFGEKVRQSRIISNLNQSELGKKINVTRQVISSYETDKSRPRGIENYKKLAIALGVSYNYLLSENDEFVEIASEKYGYNGAKQAKELVNKMGALFAGGELSSNDKDAVMRAMQEIYWDAKEENKKYTPKKYLKDDDIN